MRRNIIIDIDGTLNRFAGRFKSYAIENDAENIAILESLEPIREIVDIVKIFQWQLVNIVIATARPLRFQSQTRAWLDKYGIRWDRLYMRMDDNLHDVEVKEDILARLRADEEIGSCPIWFALEDRQACVDMWRRNGIVCLQPAACGYKEPSQIPGGLTRSYLCSKCGARVDESGLNAPGVRLPGDFIMCFSCYVKSSPHGVMDYEGQGR